VSVGAEDGASMSALPDIVVVGRVIRPHGLAGEVVVEIETDVAERFDAGSRLRLGPRGRSVEVAQARPFGDRLLVRFAGFDDRTAVEGLRGLDLTVDRGDVPAAPAGSFYHFELLDCACHDAREGELGEVIALHEDGGGTLLEVANGERKLLVPFVTAFVVRVDVAARRIELDLPPGLVDICAST
jgi:16S rRNA processing protein RimM